MHRKLSAFAGLGIVGLVIGCALLASSQTRDVRSVELLRQQGERLRLIAPHGPPQLVPPRAPGPGVIA